jgi:hypothetical protein
MIRSNVGTGMSRPCSASNLAVDSRPADRAWKAARRELVTRQGFFHALRTLTSYLVFPSWDNLLETMAFKRPPPLGP